MKKNQNLQLRRQIKKIKKSRVGNKSLNSNIYRKWESSNQKNKLSFKNTDK